MRKQRLNELNSVEYRLVAWIRKYHNDETTRQAKALPLLRDMVTLLIFVRDNKVVGTKSTGNMPLKAVREVTARFVNPPELDIHVGDEIFRLRSEAQVWQLYFLHILAEVGGLLQTAPGRRWRLTPAGDRFLRTEPLLQVAFLFSVWWFDVNWLVAFPFPGMEEYLPPYFEQTTLNHLRSLPINSRISFKKFANKLIKETELTWGNRDNDYDTMFLYGLIKDVVIDILESFGAIEYEEKKESSDLTTIGRFVAFKITPFGKTLLDSIAIWSE